MAAPLPARRSICARSAASFSSSFNDAAASSLAVSRAPEFPSARPRLWLFASDSRCRVRFGIDPRRLRLHASFVDPFSIGFDRPDPFHFGRVVNAKLQARFAQCPATE